MDQGLSDQRLLFSHQISCLTSDGWYFYDYGMRVAERVDCRGILARIARQAPIMLHYTELGPRLLHYTELWPRLLHNTELQYSVDTYTHSAECVSRYQSHAHTRTQSPETMLPQTPNKMPNSAGKW